MRREVSMCREMSDASRCVFPTYYRLPNHYATCGQPINENLNEVGNVSYNNLPFVPVRSSEVVRGRWRHRSDEGSGEVFEVRHKSDR